MQRFLKFPCNSIAELPDARFNFFTKKLWPRVKEELPPKTFIFVQNYYEYVKLKNYFE
jgi:U3 small nucleolar RNA-associated protein 25